ncbi:hypothetical protein NPIL_109401, partial [Nephila pilipes]
VPESELQSRQYYWRLHFATKQCSKEAFVDSCREQEDVDSEVKKMIAAFFSASDCNGFPDHMNSANVAKTSFTEILVTFTIAVTILLLW